MDQLKEWIEQVLEDLDCRLYELEWLHEQATPLLRISVERKQGPMDLDTCAQCSDAIGTMLDEKDWFKKEYMLEVCSPGAERELKTDEQIQNAIGSYIFVKLKNPKQGVDSVRGDLLEVNEDSVLVSYKVKGRPKKITIEKENIALIMTAVKL